MMGVKEIAIPMSVIPTFNTRKLPLPRAFDARIHWPHCPGIRSIRDQSACGSCWAFGAVEAMSDRICISSRGRINVVLSADDLLTCCHRCGYGCEGGQPLEAWKFWVTNGIVTGSNHSENIGCRPYPFPPCEHHNNRTHFPPCHHQLYTTPQCSYICQNRYGRRKYQGDKHYGAEAYGVSSDVSSIQNEIFSNGPVEAAFKVYDDFTHYQRGIYQHKAGRLTGGHAVKLLGWGEENGLDFWIVANSWNRDWGENGFFRIIRGVNECGIESGIVAGLPKLNQSRYQKWNRREKVSNFYRRHLR